MTKFLIIIFVIVCCWPQVFGFLSFIQGIYKRVYTDIVRVRTVEELADRGNLFPVLDFIGLVEQYDGYTAEEYEVETSDGYILKLHRVSGSPSSPAAYGKPVVQLGLGFCASSDVFAVMGPRQALLYMLADAGYDVWIGNLRGNTYSKRHRKYSPRSDNLAFWDFTMDEYAIIDLALFTDTILEKTKQKKLSFMGLSLGNILSTMLLSAKPEYNDKMQVVIHLAPVVLFTSPHSPLLSTLVTVGAPLKDLALAAGLYELLPQSRLTQIFGKDICVTNLGKLLCETFFSLLLHVGGMNRTTIPTLMAHYPAGSSIFVANQYIQFVQTEKFKRYDYGITKNLMKYGTPTPPEYDLTKVTSPQALIYSDADVFSSIRDVETLNRTLPNVVALEKVPGYNHIDYVFLDEARETVYKRILEIIEENSDDKVLNNDFF